MTIGILINSYCSSGMSDQQTQRDTVLATESRLKVQLETETSQDPASYLFKSFPKNTKSSSVSTEF